MTSDDEDAGFVISDDDNNNSTMDESLHLESTAITMRKPYDYSSADEMDVVVEKPAKKRKKTREPPSYEKDIIHQVSSSTNARQTSSLVSHFDNNGNVVFDPMLRSAGPGSKQFLARMFLEANNVTQFANIMADVIKIKSSSTSSETKSNKERDLGDEGVSSGTSVQKLMRIMIQRSKAGDDGESEDMYSSVTKETASTRGRIIFCSLRDPDVHYEFSLPVNFADADAPPDGVVLSVHVDAEELQKELSMKAAEVVRFSKNSADGGVAGGAAASFMQLVVFSNQIDITVFLGSSIRSRASVSIIYYRSVDDPIPDDGDSIFVLSSSYRITRESFEKAFPLHISLDGKSAAIDGYLNSVMSNLSKTEYAKCELQLAVGCTSFDGQEFQLNVSSGEKHLLTLLAPVATIEVSAEMRAPIVGAIRARYMRNLFDHIDNKKHSIVMALPDAKQLQAAWFRAVVFRLSSADSTGGATSTDTEEGIDPLQLVSRRPWFAYVQLTCLPRVDDDEHDTPAPTLSAMDSVTDILNKKPRVNACGDIEIDQDPVASFDS